ncbi:uncharacterized protein LOC142527100 [Primulina tabacum]|uniref:uncharacterized protein LOC142527100 n=1 Tax=Primulina tabacum TaxID=48773 RepID=UPI003F5935F5
MNKSIGDIVLEKALKNAKYTSSDIQKDVLNIISNQVKAKIRKEIGHAKFCILVDEARDASNKELMAIVLRFVDTEGFLRERFFAIVHVTDTTAATLGKKYLMHLVVMTCISTTYVDRDMMVLTICAVLGMDCRLFSSLTPAAGKEVSIWLFFSKLNSICNLINASPKQHGELHSAQRIEVVHMKNMVNDGASNSICGEASDALIAMKYCHMEARYKSGTSRSCQQNYSITVEHHYRFDIFTAAIDIQVEELNNRFKDEAVELLKLNCALEPKENFKLLNVDHVYRFAEKFYYLDFDSQDLHYLRIQLDHYKLDDAGHERFQNLSTISELCRRLMQTNNSGTYNLIDM